MDPLFIPCAIPVRTDELVNGEKFEAIFIHLVKNQRKYLLCRENYFQL